MALVLFVEARTDSGFLIRMDMELCFETKVASRMEDELRMDSEW